MFDNIAILIVVAPLLAALLNGLNLLCGETLYSWRVVQRITCGALLVSFVGALWVFAQILIDPTPRPVQAYEWLASGGFSVPVAFLIDSLSALMMLVVTGFSFLIAVFSVNYMHKDRSFTRYFSAIALFVFAMLILVMGNNFVMLFAGWELVGLCSYLLIGHYYDRKSAAKAGTKAFVMNRVGDAGFLMGIFLIYDHFDSVLYAEVFANAASLDTGTATAIGLCLLLGAIGKSAQLPLGTWLAKAMEGPTPSSALIHAATMVTAGIYMIARSHSIYDLAPNALLVIAIVGALTALYGALVGLTTSDIKGILAFSTTTQLGLMFLACGLGAYGVAVFHLVAHAFLKSFLFLTAPSILHHIHVKADPTARDVVNRSVPIHYWLVLVGAFAVMVLPFVSGFGSSEVVGLNLEPVTVLAAGALVSLFAALYYAMRMTQQAFGGSHAGSAAGAAAGHQDGHATAHTAAHAEHAHHAGGGLARPVLVLAGVLGLGLAAGLLPGGVDNSWFQQLLAPVLAVRPAVGGAAPALVYTLLGLLGVMLAVSWLTAIFFERFRPELPGLAMLKARRVYVASLNRFWIDEFYDRYLVGGCKRLGLTLERVDARVIDRIVGAPIPAATRAPLGGLVWEERFLAARAGGLATPLPSAADIDRSRVAAPHGLAGGLTAAASMASNWTEQHVVERASGFAGGAVEVAAAASNWTERHVVAPASGFVGWLTDLAAGVSDAVERHVFGTAINVGLPRTGGFFGHGLLRLEAFLARPVTATALLLGSLAFILVGV